MSSIPAGLARVPNLLSTQLSLAHITRSNLGLLRVQEQLSSGKLVNRVSDDAVKAAMIGVLDDRLERAHQRTRNISHAQSALSDLESTMEEVSGLGNEARGIASSMINTGFTPGDRAAQATVVSQMMSGLLTLANKKSVAGYVFGGSQPGIVPVTEFRGGFRFANSGAGVTTDLGSASTVPLTMGPNNPIGATSARVRGTADLDPDLTLDTPLARLAGGRSLGVSLGSIEFSFAAGARTSVDLSGADTVQDVADRLTSALREYESANAVTILGPGGISFAGEALTVDVVAGAPNPDLQFYDIGAGVAARDLGLAADVPFVFSATQPTGIDLHPRLDWTTPIASLAGTGGPLGTIRLRNLGGAASLDLSAATTLQDVKNIIEGTGLGVRVEINADGTGIDVLNEVAGTRAMAMSIEEVTGNNSTATRLGIRTFAADTRISDFNDGRGVRVVDGVVNPVSGVIDPALNTDFSITLGEASGTTITIDLTPADMTTVQSVVDTMNTQIAAQLATAGLLPTDLVASLSTDGNGIVLTQNATFGGPLEIATLNNSFAPLDLGLTSSTYDLSTSSYRGTDTARVRVDNLFTHLIDLRDSLSTNAVSGIALAGSGLEANLDRLTELRGLVGGYQRRVLMAERIEEDQNLIDEKVKSDLADVDVSEAAMRLSQFQTQLLAGYQATSTLLGQSLLDFLR